MNVFSLLLLWLSLLPTTQSFSSFVTTNQQQSITTLLEFHQPTIDKLKEICQQTVGIDAMKRQPYCNDMFYLRYCLLPQQPNNDDSSSSSSRSKNILIDQFRTTLEWRLSKQGQMVCSAATTAIEEATIGGSSSWNNEPVLQNAPHSDKITKYLSSANVITTVSNEKDLVYCICAGNINDVSLMKAVSIDEMTAFFLYAKEINAIVANLRSIQSNQLIRIITCNDLSNVKLIGGSSDFRKALSTSSTIANDVYPSSYTGPTLLLNLPPLVSALVKLFTPLFPKAVKERLLFEQGPLSTINSLQQIASSTGSMEYIQFMKQLDEIVYKKK